MRRLSDGIFPMLDNADESKNLIYSESPKFEIYLNSMENLNPLKNTLFYPLFNGHTHWNLKFTANNNIFQNKKTYVKPCYPLNHNTVLFYIQALLCMKCANLYSSNRTFFRMSTTRKSCPSRDKF